MTQDLTGGCPPSTHGPQDAVDAPGPCGRCGRPRCWGDAKSRPGERCRSFPKPGAVVCETHGAKAPQVAAAAQRRLLTQALEADAAAILAHSGISAIDDPVGELAKLAAEIRATLTAIGQRVNALDHIRYQTGQGEQVRAEMQLLERGQDRLIRVLDALAKLDLEGKRQAVAERYATEIVQLLMAVFTDLVLSEQQQVRVGLVVAHHLGAVVAGQLETGGVS